MSTLTNSLSGVLRSDLSERSTLPLGGEKKVAGGKRRSKRARQRAKELGFAYAMIAIPFAMLVWFGVVPFLTGVAKSFFNYNGGNINTFVGLDNFFKLLREPLFGPSLANGLLLMAFALATTTLVPLVVAWLVHHVPSPRFKYVFRVAVMLPVIVPAVIGLLVWQQILKPEGALNALLSGMGLEILTRNWFGDSSAALIGVMLVGLPWLGGINCLLYLGAYGNVPKELYEAAQLDGAGRWNMFWRVEYPFVATQTRIILTLGVIAGLQSYENVFILTGGGPGDATVVPGLLLFRHAFSYGQFGYASAIGLVIMMITLLILGAAWAVRKVVNRG